MKFINTFIFMLLGLLSFSQVPTDSLVAYYPFNGNANDSTSNGLNGIVHNASLTTNRFGQTNKAYLFNDTSNYIEIPDNNKLDFTSKVTISFWIYQTRNSPFGYCRLIDKVTSHTADGWLLDTYSSGQNLRFMVGADGSISGSYSLNQWHHIAITFEAGIVKFYIDGIFKKQVSNTYSSIPVNNLPIILGNTQPNDHDNLNYLGKMDDVGFWNRILTAQEISTIYGCRLPAVNILASGPTTICYGDSVTLSASVKKSAYTYAWYKNGTKITGATKDSLKVFQAGSYTVSVDSGYCSVLSTSKLVTVNSLPSVSCSISQNINIQDSPLTIIGLPTGGTYSGAGVSGNKFDPAIAGLGIKKVKYTYTNTNGCKNSATATTIVYDTITCYVTVYDSVSVTDTLIINAKLSGVNPPNDHNIIRVFPNPANDHVTIDFGNYGTMSGYTLKIISSAGQTVFTTLINQQSSFIDLSTWKGKGIYFVHVIDAQSNTIEVRKIVLQ